MKNKENDKFIYSVKDEIIKMTNDLIKKNKILRRCENSEVFVPIIGIIGVIIYYFLIYGNYDLNSILTKQEFYAVLFFVFIYIIAIEKIIINLKKEVEKKKNSIRNKMILRICNCKDSCYCKEKLNKYMKKNGVGII